MNAANQIAAAMFSENPDGEQECETNVNGSVQIIRLIAGPDGKGVGTRAMKAAMAVADQIGVDLQLCPDGTYYEDETSAEKRLRNWYTKLGFKPYGTSEMQRKANT